MTKRFLTTLLLVCLVGLLGGVTGLAGGGLVHAQPAPDSGVEPGSGTVGTTFIFFFDGWSPDQETIEYWVVGPGTSQPFEQGEFLNTPDTAGRTYWRWTVPSGVWEGTWTMNARDRDSYTAVQLPFVLTVEEGVAFMSGVEPFQGTIGTTFTFFTDAWPQGDIVDTWVLPPGRTDPFFLGRIYGDPDADPQQQGRTFWEWQVPADAWGGVWTMHGRGKYSEAVVHIPFVLDGPPPPDPPSSSAMPDAGYPGDVLAFTAHGYKAGEEIAYWVSAPDKIIPVDRNNIDELFADERGSVTWQWRIPDDAPMGRWIMVALGRSSDLEHHIGFDVLETGTGMGNAPVTSVVPPAGDAGTVFQFRATGFKPEEVIEYWATAPDGRTVSDPEGLFADDMGNVTLLWATSPSAVGGRWTMTLQGSNSLARVDIDFELFGTAGAAPPQQGVSPPAAEAGTTFTFFAEGFLRSEKVGWWATAPDGRVFPGGVDIEVGTQGRIEWSWTAPEFTVSGEWMMIVQGKESNIERIIPFTITSAGTVPEDVDAPAVPTNTERDYSTIVTPTVGIPGTTFTFHAEGLVPGESVGYWATAPDGRIYPAPDEINITADRNGQIIWNWTSPEDALSGQWSMVVQNTTVDHVVSNTQLSIPFGISTP